MWTNSSKSRLLGGYEGLRAGFGLEWRNLHCCVRWVEGSGGEETLCSGLINTGQDVCGRAQRKIWPLGLASARVFPSGERADVSELGDLTRQSSRPVCVSRAMHAEPLLTTTDFSSVEKWKESWLAPEPDHVHKVFRSLTRTKLICPPLLIARNCECGLKVNLAISCLMGRVLAWPNHAKGRLSQAVRLLLDIEDDVVEGVGIGCTALGIEVFSRHDGFPFAAERTTCGSIQVVEGFFGN
jgi:hypothetical protein